MKVYGKVYSVNRKERLISMIINNRLMSFHMTNKNMRDFKTYLNKLPYVFLDVQDDKVKNNNKIFYEINYFIKIVVPRVTRSDVYYDLSMIKKGVKSLLNREQTRLFLDLEFTLPNSNHHLPEIVQYGMVVEDENNNIIFEDSSLVKPNKKSSLNKRTLKFLSLNYKDFDNACPYIEFYQILERWINEHDVKIIAWGKNDILTLEKSFKINHLKPLDIRNRYMNLMQIMKNYYNNKQEMGLFNTYQTLTNTAEVEQSHNAFEDALMLRDIFHIFKHNINEEDY